MKMINIKGTDYHCCSIELCDWNVGYLLCHDDDIHISVYDGEGIRVCNYGETCAFHGFGVHADCERDDIRESLKKGGD